MSLKETKKIATNRYELEITVDGEKFREAIKEAYKRNGKKINVPGFRKGKAPLSIVVKDEGRTSVSIFLHHSNAKLSTVFKPFGKLTAFKYSHWLKAWSLIVVNFELLSK